MLLLLFICFSQPDLLLNGGVDLMVLVSGQIAVWFSQLGSATPGWQRQKTVVINLKPGRYFVFITGISIQQLNAEWHSEGLDQSLQQQTIKSPCDNVHGHYCPNKFRISNSFPSQARNENVTPEYFDIVLSCHL